MIRKTISINEDLYHSLELNHLIDKYQSFSELVSNSLKLILEKQEKEAYKKAMIEAAQDQLYKEDMIETEEAFKYSDGEILK